MKKKCKIEKHMELGLYRNPILNFQGSRSKWASQGIYVKILICSKKCWKIQFRRQLLHISHPFFRSTLFFSTSQLSFPPEQLSTLHVLINNDNNHLTVLFRTLLSRVKDENFQSISVFYQVELKNVI